MSASNEANIRRYFYSNYITLERVKSLVPDPNIMYRDRYRRNLLMIYLTNKRIVIDENIISYLATDQSIQCVDVKNTNVLTAYLRRCGLNINTDLFDKFVSVDGATICCNVEFFTTALNAYLRNKNKLDVKIVQKLANHVSINNIDINGNTALSNYLFRSVYDQPPDYEIVKILTNDFTKNYFGRNKEPALLTYLSKSSIIDIEIVKLLVTKENLATENENGYLALHLYLAFSSKKISVDIVKILANMNSINHMIYYAGSYGNSLDLYSAINSNINDEIVDLLNPFKNTVKFDNNMECVICMEKMQIHTMSVLKCKHVLHKSCFDQWMEVSHNRKCPICRSVLDNSNLDNDDDDDDDDY